MMEILWMILVYESLSQEQTYYNVNIMPDVLYSNYMVPERGMVCRGISKLFLQSKGEYC